MESLPASLTTSGWLTAQEVTCVCCSATFTMCDIWRSRSGQNVAFAGVSHLGQSPVLLLSQPGQHPDYMCAAMKFNHCILQETPVNDNKNKVWKWWEEFLFHAWITANQMFRELRCVVELITVERRDSSQAFSVFFFFSEGKSVTSRLSCTLSGGCCNTF